MSKDKNRNEKSDRRDDDHDRGNDHEHDSGHKIMDKINVILGTKLGDVLQGTDGRDLILGKNGNDKIDGGAGNDVLFGGKGNDQVFGGTGDDFVFGGKGNDQVDGGAGNDKVFGGKGDDLANYTLSENVGAHDFYDGGKGFDTLQLTLTSAELAAAKNDISAFQAFLDGKSNAHGDDGKAFHFSSFDLTVRNFEALKIVEIGGNTPPVANSDSATTDEDHPVVINALANDSGNALSLVTAGVTVGLGTATIIGGQIDYNPGDSYQYLAAGALANVVIDYTIVDSHGANAFSFVDVVVTGVNDAPIAVDDSLENLTATVSGSAGSIRVAVVGLATSSYLQAQGQLNDSTVFNFSTTAIEYTNTRAWTDLTVANYDVVVLGDSGSLDYSTATGIFSALRGFVDSGGGVITTGWFAGALSIMDAGIKGDADYITPITTAGNNYAGTRQPGADTFTVLDPTHAIAGGLSSFQSSSKFGWELAKSIDVDAGAVKLATGISTDPDQTSQIGAVLPAIAYDAVVGLGRTAYLGGMYLANDVFQPKIALGETPIRTGVLDQIFERAVAWAAGDRSGGGTGATVNIHAAQLLANDTDVDTPHDLLTIGSISPTSALGAAITFDHATGEIMLVYAPGTEKLPDLLAGTISDSFDYTAFDGSLSSVAPAHVDFTVI
ncbi:MAG: Ig-like domain-containing protein [Burkholderiales bacterium]